MKNKVVEDYVDEDGCLHCGICRKRKQMKVSLMGFEQCSVLFVRMRGKSQAGTR